MHPLAVLKKSYIDSTEVYTESLLHKNKTEKYQPSYTVDTCYLKMKGVWIWNTDFYKRRINLNGAWIWCT